MKRWLLLVVALSAVVVAIVLFVPSILNAPGCAHMVDLSAACREGIARE